MQVETVKIAAEKTDGNPNGYIVINKSDFDPKQHKEYVEPKGKNDAKDSGK